MAVESLGEQCLRVSSLSSYLAHRSGKDLSLGSVQRMGFPTFHGRGIYQVLPGLIEVSLPD